LAKKKSIFIGKRKEAVAKASIKKGSGKIKVNKIPVENLKPEMIKLMIKEPIIISGDLHKKADISVEVKGGGVIGQAEAVRQAIALALLDFGGKKYKKMFEDYDRHLLVKDSRRTEPHKPSRSSAGPRRHKQRSKR